MAPRRAVHKESPEERIVALVLHHAQASTRVVLEHALALLEYYQRELTAARLQARDVAVSQREPLGSDESNVFALRPIAGAPGFCEEILCNLRLRRWLISLSREQIGRIVAALTREQAMALQQVYASWSTCERGGES